MFDLIYHFPEQLEEAFSLSFQLIKKRKDFLDKINNINKIIITGMGGSGIAGDIVFSLSYPFLKHPLIVIKDYQLPSFSNKNSLYFIISYSGETEETIFNYKELKKKNLPLIVITSNGSLKELSKKNGDLLFLLPENYPPRQALAYLTIPILLTLSYLKIIPDFKKDIEKTILYLKKIRKKLNEKAKGIIKIIENKIPYIIVDSYSYLPIAYRWKNQFNENTKILAFYNYLPEQNHNEINALPFLEAFKNNLFVFILKNPNSYKRNLLRIIFLLKILKEKKIANLLIKPFNKNNFLNIFSLIMLGDFISYHWALKREIDPLKIEVIDKLKNFLNKF
ncbi:MAG: bifunctional phosphoglucose/phosphomannose isomerase [candidate division WOR-3 bacterium]|nr:bifunctional phosphoglucose/phosphomannose isomerase [candidate division WOR-3 bacterium]MCX7837544.1 bifunctional phosphoglucose/phosphomannose isomerase [candidate division WOR-3 bacterium]MDW8113642.1 bifunctional phosphoglucose/phosphomannose isomerase [candidate division WOR-3 bacterium]